MHRRRIDKIKRRKWNALQKMPRYPTDPRVGKEDFAMRFLINFFLEEEAATAVEYAVVLAMILITIISAIGAVGTRTGGMWSGIMSDLQSIGF
jgi:pilus assembly protein Flp/PilA